MIIRRAKSLSEWLRCTKWHWGKVKPLKEDLRLGWFSHSTGMNDSCKEFVRVDFVKNCFQVKSWRFSSQRDTVWCLLIVCPDKGKSNWFIEQKSPKERKTLKGFVELLGIYLMTCHKTQHTLTAKNINKITYVLLRGSETLYLHIHLLVRHLCQQRPLRVKTLNESNVKLASKDQWWAYQSISQFCSFTEIVIYLLC